MKERKHVSAFCEDILGTADAVEIARRIESREINAYEAVDAAIARAERVNPSLNAIATPLFDAARTAAGRSRSGGLAGVPSFIKDNEAVAGAPLLHGSRGLPNRPSEESSPFVEQFLSPGLINLGTTTMPEFGLTGTTEALVYGPTHNPWRLGFSPGGSSGGSAALVAAGVVPIAHANDGGGSTRIPASCCGLVGLKPSRGRLVDMEGAALFPVKIVHQGMLSRTVRDTAAFYDAAERHYRNPKLPEIGLVTHPGRRLRVGFFTDLDEATPSHPDCVAAVTDTAKLLEGLGHSVELVTRPFDDGFLEDFFLFWSMLSFAVTRFGTRLVHPDFDASKVEDFTSGLADYFKENMQKAPAAIWRLRKFAHQYARGFDQYDVLMNPSVAMPPPEHGYIGPSVPFDTALERLKWFIPFTPTQNVSGGPAISLPLGQSEDGMPLGVQLASPLGDERTLLELALEIEAAAPWPRIGS
ncbi:MAG: amidase [Myxococcales bacterium]|nr:amidase [Myxococcales bacterium]